MAAAEKPYVDGRLLPFDKPLYSIREAAEVLRIGRSTLYREIAAGRVKVHKIAMRTVIRRDDLERLIEGGKP